MCMQINEHEQIEHYIGIVHITEEINIFEKIKMTKI